MVDEVMEQVVKVVLAIATVVMMLVEPSTRTNINQVNRE